jgi:hypothetical protein
LVAACRWHDFLKPFNQNIRIFGPKGGSFQHLLKSRSLTSNPLPNARIRTPAIPTRTTFSLPLLLGSAAEGDGT